MPAIGNAEGARSLHVVELGELQRLGAQKPREPRPAGDPQDRRKQEQPDVRALEAGLEHLRVLVDVDLDHQHERRDQQHRRDRREHRVEVLDRIVDDTLVIAGEDAEHDRERQRRECRERADHDRRAYRLDRLEQNVVAGLIGSEHVIPRPQRGDPAGEQRQHRRGEQHRPPWDTRSLAPGSRAATRGPRFARSGRAARRRPATEARRPPLPRRVPPPSARARRATHSRSGILQVRAAELQAGVIANGLAVDEHRFLRVLVRAERDRIGLLARFARSGEQRVEQRQRARRVPGRGARRRAGRRRQQRPEMDRVENRSISRKTASSTAADIAAGSRTTDAPRLPKRRRAQRVPRVESDRDQQQVENDVGREEDGLRHFGGSSSGGSADRRRCTKCRSGSGRRCRAPSRRTPSSARSRSPAR